MQGVKFPIAHLWGVIFIHVFSEFLDLPWTLCVDIFKKWFLYPASYLFWILPRGFWLLIIILYNLSFFWPYCRVSSLQECCTDLSASVLTSSAVASNKESTGHLRWGWMFVFLAVPQCGICSNLYLYLQNCSDVVNIVFLMRYSEVHVSP